MRGGVTLVRGNGVRRGQGAVKLLADENIERPIVAWLRETGHDVLWVPESHASEADLDLVDMARREGRLILTYDLHFGGILFRDRVLCDGVILLRCKALSKKQRIAWFQAWWPQLEQKALNHFVVLHNNRLRVRSLWHEG